jgi:hypothetical protein
MPTGSVYSIPNTTGRARLQNHPQNPDWFTLYKSIYARLPDIFMNNSKFWRMRGPCEIFRDLWTVVYRGTWYPMTAWHYGDGREGGHLSFDGSYVCQLLARSAQPGRSREWPWRIEAVLKAYSYDCSLRLSGSPLKGWRWRLDRALQTDLHRCLPQGMRSAARPLVRAMDGHACANSRSEHL